MSLSPLPPRWHAGGQHGLADAAQGEGKGDILRRGVQGTPPIDTVTVMLVVPNAESGAAPTPRTGAVTVTAATTDGKAYRAGYRGGSHLGGCARWSWHPQSVWSRDCSVTVATPEASVSAVAAGRDGCQVASVLKVTTALGTTAPHASFNVAFTVAGAPMEIEAYRCTGSIGERQCECRLAGAELLSTRMAKLIAPVAATVPTSAAAVMVVAPTADWSRASA